MISRSSFFGRVAARVDIYGMIIEQGRAGLEFCERLLNGILTDKPAMYISCKNTSALKMAEIDDANITVHPDHRAYPRHPVYLSVLASSDDSGYLLCIDSLLVERNHNKETLFRVDRFRVEPDPRVVRVSP